VKLFLPLFFCLVGVLSAQQSPALLVKEDGKASKPLTVDRVEVRVEVIGNVAETTMTLRFRNDTDRVLEGELIFPLQEGQTISSYALGIEGEMRAGVVVEKQRARSIFEDIVRQGIDPGLIEWTKGRNFRTRVYPIPAQGTKRVRLGYQEVLPKSDGGLRYRLPLKFRDKLSHFSISMQVPQAIGPFAVLEDDSSGLEFKHLAREGWKWEAIEKNYLATGAIELAIPVGNEPLVTIGKGTKGSEYFHVVDQVEVPENPSQAGPTASSILLIWDASGSGASRDHEKEFEVLGQLLEFHQGAVVDLVLMRHRLENIGRFRDAPAIMKALKEISYDGGTDSGQLDFSETEQDLIFLVSDGIGTMGLGKAEPGDAPVHVFHAAESAEHDALKNLALKTGGSYQNLQSIPVEEAVARMTGEVFSLLSIEGGEEIYPQHRVPVSLGGVVNLTGRLPGDQQLNLTLKYGLGNEVLLTRTITIDPQNSEFRSSMVAKLWAAHRLESLLGDRHKNKKAITSLGKEFGLVTPYTSLLVLDRVWDYVEHRIVPPTAKLRKEYEELLKEEEERARFQDDPRTHLDTLASQWMEMRKWHSEDFDPIDVLLHHRLFETRKSLKELLSWRLSKVFRSQPKGEKEKLRKLDAELARVQDDLAKLGQVEEGKRREVILSYAKRFERAISELDQSKVGDFQEMQGRIRIPGVPAGKGDVSSIITAGLRSGASAISRNSIDALLSRGNRVADSVPPPAPMVLPMMGGSDDEGHEAKIKLAGWDPKTPYLKALKSAPKSKREKVYFDWRKKNLKSSAFYLDVSGFFIGQDEKDLALRVLTNVAELDLESVPLMRTLAHRLNQLGQHKHALAIFEEVRELRPEEPQSQRDLALTLASLGRNQEAVTLLWELIKKPVDDRFEGMHLVSLVELNAIMTRHRVRPSGFDQRFAGNLDCDARIVLTWDSNDSDMDLWVTDVLGERCSYAHNRTRSGGRMSDDFTNGYGPEEFLIRRALHGSYKIEVNYFGTSQQIIAGGTTVQAEIFTNWGRPNQKSRKITLQLKGQKEIVFVGEVDFR
jgi:tetratricopeptide (TPR) repeat protein